MLRKPAYPLSAHLQSFPMLADNCAFAFLRSKSAILELALVLTSTLVFSQDSFRFHYTSSALDGMIVNRGDFNNDGIPDLVVGNNEGTGGYGISVLLGKAIADLKTR